MAIGQEQRRQAASGEFFQLAGVAALLAAAWFPQLLPGRYSVDDYRNLLPGALPELLAAEIGQGRPLQALLHALSWRLGVDPIHSPGLANLIALVLFAGCGVLLARIWRIESWPAGAALAGAVAFTHPFFADLWSFRLAPVSLALALVPALVALELARRERARPILSALLFCASLGVYQLALDGAAVALCIAALADLARAPAGERAWHTLRPTLRAAACALAGAAAYLVLDRLVREIAHVPAEHRAGLVALAQLPERAGAVMQQLWRVLFAERQLGMGLLAALQLLLLALGLTSAMRRARATLAFALALIALLPLALASTVGLVGLARDFWPSPRTLVAAGFFWAGALALAALSESALTRKVALVLGGLVWLGQAGIAHRAADEQHRLNQRDLLRMSRVLGRLEALPGAAAVRRLAIHDGPNSYGDFKTVTGDLNVSALYKPWSWAGLAAETGGAPLEPTRAEDVASAAQRCVGAPRWPASGAVFIEGELAIVCF